MPHLCWDLKTRRGDQSENRTGSRYARHCWHYSKPFISSDFKNCRSDDPLAPAEYLPVLFPENKWSEYVTIRDRFETGMGPFFFRKIPLIIFSWMTHSGSSIRQIYCSERSSAYLLFSPS